MKPLRLVSASDAAWTPISELKGTKSYTVNTESDSWMEGRDLIAIKVISEGKESVVRLKLGKMGKGWAKFEVTAGKKDKSTSKVTVVATTEKSRKRKFKDDQFIRVFEITRNHEETGSRIGITPEYVSRTAKRIEAETGCKLKHRSEKNEVIRLFGKPLQIALFIKAWNRCDTIDEVVDALSLSDLGKTRKEVKSRLSILAHRIRKADSSVELKKFKRGRQAQAVSE